MADFSLASKRVCVTGSRGLVGGALLRRLAAEPCELLTASRQELDLRNQAAVLDWMVHQRPDAVIAAAAKVGGIFANEQAPADFLYDNLMIEANLIHSTYLSGVKKLLFLGSSCIYPTYSEPEPINVGTGVDVSIAELAHITARVIDYQGRFVFNTLRPDGTPRKLLDVSRLAERGWRARTDLEAGIAKTYAWFLKQRGTTPESCDTG